MQADGQMLRIAVGKVLRCITWATVILEASPITCAKSSLPSHSLLKRIWVFSASRILSAGRHRCGHSLISRRQHGRVPSARTRSPISAVCPR